MSDNREMTNKEEDEMIEFQVNKEATEIINKIEELRSGEYPFSYRSIGNYLNCGYRLGEYDHWVMIDDDAIEVNVLSMERKEKLKAVKENIKNTGIDEMDLYDRCQTCPFNEECNAVENLELCLAFSNKWYKENRRKK